MNEPQHTPAPWTYSPQHGTPGHCTMAQIWRPDGKCLTAIEPTESPAEATANARLIAAAPDLLAALAEALDSIRIWYNMANNGDEDKWQRYVKNSPKMHRFNEAILKATGHEA